ncbi:MAG: HU family DNA-binding protein [Planctomycetales bacterium]|nr:HU family DNA-binding protein [Planctomycetales bacterium]
MNREGLITLLAADGFPSKAAAERALEAVVLAIRKGLQKDRRVVISGFGAFRVRQLRAGEARNPRTGESVRVRARRGVLFRAGKDLKKSL